MSEETELRELERRLGDDDAHVAEFVGSGAKPDLGIPLKAVSSSLVRDWVRSALVPDAVKRLFDIGMGVTRFDVPTMAGNTVNVAAPSSVQVRALQGVVAIGVPQQLGLTDDADPVPGVLAVGEWELAAARDEVHPGDARRLTGGIEVSATDEPSTVALPNVDPSGVTPGSVAGISNYVPPEGHEVVVVEDEDSHVTNDTRAEMPPPPVDVDRNTLAREFLARRRAARQTLGGPGAGPMPGDHPNLS